jgi:hypothetical protein
MNLRVRQIREEVEIETVEYDHDLRRYRAILSDGDTFHLDSSNLAEAQREARRIVDSLSGSVDHGHHDQD